MLTKPSPPPDTTDHGAFVTIIGHRCFRCGHAWRPRDINIYSVVCPRCKSPRWTFPRTDKTTKKWDCIRCGGKHSNFPYRCPKVKA